MKGKKLKPGDSQFCQIRFADPVALLPGDLAVIRSYSPVQTIGGAEVLNVIPVKHKRLNPEVLSQLKIFETGIESEKVALQVLLAGAMGMSRTESWTGLACPVQKIG